MMRLLSRAGASTSALGFNRLSRACSRGIVRQGPYGTAAAMASKPSSSDVALPLPLQPPPPPPPPPPPAASVSSRLYPNGLAVIELNRPGKLNALDADCCDAISASLLAFEKLAAEGRGGGGEGKGGVSPPPRRSSSSVLPRALLLTGSREGANKVAFCAGGDVRKIREAALAQPVRERAQSRSRSRQSQNPFPLPPRAHACERVFQAEYSMLSLLSFGSLPVLTLVDGIQMGLGAGISSAALCSNKGKGGISVVTERALWAMPEGKIGLFPDVGFLASAPGLAAVVAANAREAAAAAAVSSSSSSTSSEKAKGSKNENTKNSLLFSAEAALLFGLTGARIEGGEALVAAGLASFCVSSKEGGAESLLAALAGADFGDGGEDASEALFAAAAKAAVPPSIPSSSSSSLLLLEAAAEGGSLRPSLRRALDYRGAAAEGGAKAGEGGDGKRLSRALVALRGEWEALSREKGCAAATSALEAWLGSAAGEQQQHPASCPLSSALTLRLASDAEREAAVPSSLWTSDPAAALRAQLSREFYPAARLAVSEAFAEGVRATLVDKKKGSSKLNWPSCCASLEAVDDADVEALLLSSGSEDSAVSSAGLDVEGYLGRGCLLD